MNVVFRLAWQCFFAKSNQTVINRINAIAVVVVVVTSAALLVVLSAFSGLEDFGVRFTSGLDPDFKLIPRQENTPLDSIDRHSLNQASGLISWARSIGRKVFLSFESKNQVAILKASHSIIPIPSP